MACRENDAFGPVSKCRPFDLTQLFEESIFGIGVPSLFAIIAAVRIFHLQATPRKSKVDHGDWLCMDLVSWLVLGGLSLGVLITWCLRTHLTTLATIPAAALEVVIVVLLALTTRQESIRSERPPLVASGYLSLSLLLDIARIRTYWLLPDLRVIASLYMGQSALKLTSLTFLLCRHTVRYRKIGRKDFAAEQYAGLFGLGLWSWLNSFLLHGYRHGIATFNDLDSIDADLLSSKEGSVLEANWRKLRGNQVETLLTTAINRQCDRQTRFAQGHISLAKTSSRGTYSTSPRTNIFYLHEASPLDPQHPVRRKCCS